MIKAEEREWISPREASGRFQVAIPTVYHWCRRGMVTLMDASLMKQMGLAGKYWMEVESVRRRRDAVYFGGSVQ